MATETTDILSLPYIMPSQAQKHVTHNEAIAMLDVLVQAVVADEVAAPPDTAAPGDRLIVASDPAGAFTGKAGALAVHRDGGWTFQVSQIGWTVYDRTRQRVLVFTESGWTELPPPRSLTELETVGVNATADSGNRLAVASPASLFDHEGSDHRLKVNKAKEADTASLLFQDGYSGRAEMGLAGGDDFIVKISADGANWLEAMRIDRASGKPSFPQGIAGFREVLPANRTYYVRAGGSDDNDGLSGGKAFLSIRKAVDVALALDMSIYSVVIDIGAGTFSVGGGLLINGNGNARITLVGAGQDQTAISGSGTAIAANYGVVLTVKDLTITGGVIGLWARYGASVTFLGTVRLSGGTSRLVGADTDAVVAMNSGTILIDANSSCLLYCTNGGHMIFANGATFKTTAARTFGYTVYAVQAAVISFTASQVTWDISEGAITGRRYMVATNAVIDTVTSGGANYIPGSIDGVTATGGQYAG